MFINLFEKKQKDNAYRYISYGKYDFLDLLQLFLYNFIIKYIGIFLSRDCEICALQMPSNDGLSIP